MFKNGLIKDNIEKVLIEEIAVIIREMIKAGAPEETIAKRIINHVQAERR